MVAGGGAAAMQRVTSLSFEQSSRDTIQRRCSEAISFFTADEAPLYASA